MNGPQIIRVEDLAETVGEVPRNQREVDRATNVRDVAQPDELLKLRAHGWVDRLIQLLRDALLDVPLHRGGRVLIDRLAPDRATRRLRGNKHRETGCGSR